MEIVPYIINWLLKQFFHIRPMTRNPRLRWVVKNENSDFLIPIRLLDHGHLLFGFTTPVDLAVSIRFECIPMTFKKLFW